jgi:hypothetical protein
MDLPEEIDTNPRDKPLVQLRGFLNNNPSQDEIRRLWTDRRSKPSLT